MRRKVYLSMKSLTEARDLFFSRFGPEKKTNAEEIRAEDATGRVTAEPLFAKRSSPSFHSAAMDGIAVKAEMTYGVTERHARILKLNEDAVWVNTGQPLPEGSDSVIMVEKIHEMDNDRVEIRSPSYPWQHVRKVGEDIVASQLLFPQNHRIRPFDIGALISAGLFSVKVRQRPLVTIIPTGSELVSYKHVTEKEPLPEDKILECNSLVLKGLVLESGGIPVSYHIVPDSHKKIRMALERAVESDSDIIIINAGSSAGSKDYTAQVIGEMGEIVVHGVAMMPGKPTILGIIAGKPVIGNPGYPVSSLFSFEQFVRPLIYSLQGSSPPKDETIVVRPTRDIPSKLGIEEFLRVNIGKVGRNYTATPLARAAGAITTLTKAEGILRIPALSEGISQNEEVEAGLLVEPKDLLNTVVVIGSHDMTLDILADEIRREGLNLRISSGNVGSLGGLIALRKGSCHMAGSHLLDTETGEYNLPFVRKYMKGMKVSIFHLVLRDQGLIIAKGNPKKIKGIKDLVRKDITFVNRQPGSGTRILLDYKLEQLGIDPQSINGYERTEYTHMTVAVDVLSGAADCGMGIFAAAKALDLNFVSMVREQYDLIIPSEFLDTPNIQAVLKSIRSPHFRERVTFLGGYDPSKSGELRAEL
ncbi:MAG: molybdopterin biosynthesis protein [Desulfatiglans sp.]|nr:molybdopterin biosynthesis protein [Desulfatiglans sp.]